MRKLVLAALVGLTAVTACSDDDTTAPANEGRVRVVHAISNVATTDIFVDATKVKAGLAYMGAEGYRAAAAGTRAIKVRKAAATADLVSVNATVAKDKDYTVIAYGTEAQPKSFLLTDDNAAPAAGKAKVRVAHAANGQPAVDVYVVKAEADVATATPVATNVAAGAASAYATVNADTYFVVLTGVGTKTVVLSVAGVDLASGKIRTVVAFEKTGGGTPLQGAKLSDK